ncbi:MAG: adenine methyltransferase [Ekhidna sp.]|nr:adenine methyltransferase [Ekhidna sp.]
MKAHQSTIGRNDEWLTPPDVLAPLGKFDLDPCAPVNRPWPTAECHYTEADNGLALAWRGRVWCNPPFNRNERPKWMERVAQHGNAVMLIPAATETKAFFDHVWQKADAVLFLEGRPHFHYVDGSRAKANCGTSICLVAYGAHNAEILAESGLGKFISLNK